MLGRNHALYAAAAWLAAYPSIAPYAGIEDASSLAVLGVTTAVAAGAGVVPDLDHPDALASRHFGPLSVMMAKTINSASGGHRVGTHSLLCAALLGAVAFAAQYSDSWGRVLAVISCGFCASVGLALVGPSLGFRIPTSADIFVGAGVGWWVWAFFPAISGALWVLAAGGVVVHCLCDALTKGGVPFFFPFSKKKYGLGLFRVGGAGEAVASLFGMVGLFAAVWNVSSTVGRI